MPRAQLLYPDRVRCRKCRRYFAFEVVQRLYCSKKCAGIDDELDPELSRVPRSCKVRDSDGGWQYKQVWWRERDVKLAAKRKGAGDWYLCDGERGCLGYHLTKFSPDQWAEVLARRENP